MPKRKTVVKEINQKVIGKDLNLFHYSVPSQINLIKRIDVFHMENGHGDIDCTQIGFLGGVDNRIDSIHHIFGNESEHSHLGAHFGDDFGVVLFFHLCYRGNAPNYGSALQIAHDRSVLFRRRNRRNIHHFVGSIPVGSDKTLFWLFEGFVGRIERVGIWGSIVGTGRFRTGLSSCREVRVLLHRALGNRIVDRIGCGFPRFGGGRKNRKHCGVFHVVDGVVVQSVVNFALPENRAVCVNFL
jgi:hypothetical protein